MKLTKRLLISDMDQKTEQMPKQMEVDGDSLNQNLQELVCRVKEFKDMYHSLAEHCKSSNPSDLHPLGSRVMNFFGRHQVQTLDRRPSCPRAEGYEILLKDRNAKNLGTGNVSTGKNNPMKILERIVELVGKVVEDQKKKDELGLAALKEINEDHEAVLSERVKRLRG